MQTVATAGLVPTSASALPPFALRRPSSVHEVVAALDGEAHPVLLAGGTDLVAAFNEGLMPGTLIDLSRVAALRRVEHSQGELRIGAAVTHAAGCADALVREHARGFADAWRRIANPRIRFTGTLGGNVMARRARYEGSLLLCALDARLGFVARGGARTLAPAALWQGTAVERALLESITIRTEGLVWFDYERSMRPLMTLAAALRRGTQGLELRVAVATEYLAPIVLSRSLPAARLADLPAIAREQAHALMADLPDSFTDPVVNARYARAAGAALLARQLTRAAHG
jgi:aerobic carbon-monoxide dehydrogenase medium subunit